MLKDSLVLFLLFLTGVTYLFYNTEEIHSYPYFMVATFIVFTSISLFFIFLRRLSGAWFQRMMIVNIGVIIFIPIIEGIDWIYFTILYFLLLSVTFLGYSIYKRKNTN